MITKNPMQLKAYIKKKAAEKHISAQLVMQNYMLERLLERISLSPYKHNFIIKGGFLVSAIVGLDTRATMDLDTTIKGFTLTHEAILSIFKDVCAIQIDDDVQFEVVCFIMFGKESAGIPEDILYDNQETAVRIPMINDIRSLNLSNSVAIVLYEALRQNNFDHMQLAGHLRTHEWR